MRFFRNLLLVLALAAAPAIAQAASLLPATTITTAVSSLTPGIVYQFRPAATGSSARHLTIQGKFTYGSSGTTVDAYVQTSCDGAQTWVDIAQYHFTTSSQTFLYNLSSMTAKTTEVTPTNGSLSANTSVDGLICPLIQVQYKSSGTYAGGTTLQVDIDSNDRILPANSD